MNSLPAVLMERATFGFLARCDAALTNRGSSFAAQRYAVRPLALPDRLGQSILTRALTDALLKHDRQVDQASALPARLVDSGDRAALRRTRAAA
jgi:hypothetical protein